LWGERSELFSVISCLLAVEGFRWWVLCDGDMEAAIKHPQAPEQKIIVAVAKIIYCEERSGGVAAIEQPPQDGNES